MNNTKTQIKTDANSMKLSYYDLNIIILSLVY
jgi:hypothetical protein